MQLCECQNGGKCKPDTGACICRAGFNGLHCDLTCPKGTFGINCSQLCDCNALPDKKFEYNNEQTINNNLTFLSYSINGVGGSLDDIGYSSINELKKDENIVVELVECDPINGECICPPGLSGRFCNESKIQLKKIFFF